MSYTKSYTAWADFPNVSTPATAAKLQNMDDGINNAVQSISSISLSIAAVSAQAYGSVQKSIGSASGDLVYFSGPSTPTRLSIGTSSQILAVSAGLPKWTSPTLNSSLAYTQKALTADVAMTTANTYYDGPSLSLTAGTYLLNGVVTCTRVGGATDFTAKLWDGTTVRASAQSNIAVAADACAVPVTAVVALTATATMKVSAAASAATCLMSAAAPNNSAGNNASTLVAVQIA